jgi:flagellar biosynthesis protein FlhA
VHAQAHRLLSLEDVRQLTDHLKQTQPSVVDELTPALLPLALIQRVLASLLAERVSINDLGRIYEALALRAKSTTEVPALVEAARAALGPAIPARFAHDGRLRVVMFDTLWEQQMLEGLRHVEGRSQIVLTADQTMQVMEGVRRAIADVDPVGGEPVLVCAPTLRQGVRSLLAGQVGAMPILSYDEAAAGGFATDVVGVVRPEQVALPSS